ncbi:MAG: replication initiation factor domain-containing protein, partial [Pseudomonadota bacterium]|nr:replication initiation factor domain-containing protein [Pseudomonadota bacterium]
MAIDAQNKKTLPLAVLFKSLYSQAINPCFSDAFTLPTSDLWKQAENAQTRLDLHPLSNTGQKLKLNSQQSAGSASQLETFYKDYPVLDTVLLTVDGELSPTLIRRPAANECVVVDWLTVTISVDTFAQQIAGLSYEKMHETVISELDEVLKSVLGLTIIKTQKNGRSYYEKSYDLVHFDLKKPDNGIDCGFVCIGGQRNTVMVTLNGHGCALADYAWEQSFYNWLKNKTVRPKITRVDYAYDDLDGSLVNVDWADEQDTLGGFTSGGRPPSVEYRGDWKRPNGSGRSFYIGKRTSSKYCRFYEKGKQLGDTDSPWVRVEVEYKAKHYHLPLEAMLDASEYFLAAYPCFHVFDDQTKAKKFELI